MIFSLSGMITPTGAIESEDGWRRDGIVTDSRVPAPRSPLICSTPPSLSTRSRMPSRPKWGPDALLQPLLETAAVVLHDEVGGLGLEAQRDVDAPGVGVLDGVGHRLETDPQQVVLLRGVEPLRRAFDAHVGQRARSARHLPREVRQGAGEVAALERL